MKKRIFSLLLVMALLLASLPLTALSLAAAYDPTPYFIVSDAANFTGNTVTVTVTLAEGNTIDAVYFDLLFDPASLELVSFAKGNITGDYKDSVVADVPGKISFQVLRFSRPADNILLTATFRILDNAPSQNLIGFDWSLIGWQTGDISGVNAFRNGTVTAYRLNPVVTNCTIRGGSNGQVNLAPNADPTLFEFSRDGGDWQASPLFTGLAAGSYSFRARLKSDPTMLSSAQTVQVTEPGPVKLLSALPTHSLSSATPNGKITVTASGGNGVYQYSVDNGVSWQDANPITGLKAGIYAVRVRDKLDPANADGPLSVQITQPLSNGDPGAVAPTVTSSASSLTSSAASSTSTSAATSSATSSASSTSSALVNTATSVQVEAPAGVLPPNTQLVVSQQTPSATSEQQTLQEALQKTLGNIVLTAGDNYTVYDITLQQDGAPIQPGGEVTVRIPAGNLQEPVTVFRLETDGSLTDMHARLENGYIVFTTAHFSTYVVVNADYTANPGTGSGSLTFLLGLLSLLSAGAALLLLRKAPAVR